MTAQDTTVIGAGIVGLAIARRLLETYPGAAVTVVDKEAGIGMHQTTHNSGVVHAGVYYRPGSLKAALCSRGRELMKEYCVDKRLPYTECGKLIVATEAEEIPKLRELGQRAEANGVPGARYVSATELIELEPHAHGVAALHSPRGTAVVDYAAIAAALAAEISQLGGKLLLSAEVKAFRREPPGVRVVTTAGDVVTRRAVTCVGLQSDRVAVLAGDVADPAIVPFRGEYYRLGEEASHLVNGLIYPVPDPRYPFLGVHFTRRVRGGVDIGPNAVLALAREGYRRRDVKVSDVMDIVRWSGFRSLARSHWRMGVREVHTSLSRRAFLDKARRYVPSLGYEDLLPAPAGVRAQAVAADGSLVDDFSVHFLGPVVAVRNAPSPAATSSLAIAEHIASRVAEGAS